MTQVQTNYLTMANVSLSYLETNKELWNPNSVISEQVGLVTGTVGRIKVLAGIQSESADGSTDNKDFCWRAAATISEHVAIGTRAYFESVHDLINFPLVDFEYGDFYPGNINKCIERMKLVQKKASDIEIGKLVDFELVAKDITDQTSAIAKLEEAIPLHKEKKIDTKDATANLRKEFTTLRSQFGTLDNRIKIKKRSEPSFVSKYTFSRKVVNVGKGHVTEIVDLMPEHFEALLGKKISTGDVLTIRNHSNFDAMVAMSDTPSEFPIDHVTTIGPMKEMKFVVPDDFGGVFGHWLMVNNANHFDDVSLTILLSRG